MIKENKQFSKIPKLCNFFKILKLIHRFVFVLLAPFGHSEQEIEAVGRAFGTFMVDEVFQTLAYRSKNSQDLCIGIDEFLSQALIVPAGRISYEYRLEPTSDVIERKPGKISKRQVSIFNQIQMHELAHAAMPMELKRTGTCFGGLIADVKRKAKWYWSDFRDAFRSDTFAQCLAATFFLFFANITKIITFGGVMEAFLDKNMVK